MSTEKKIQFIVNTIFYGAIVCIVLIACSYLIPILFPFIISFVFASILVVPARILAGKNSKIRRVCAIAVGVVFFAALFWGVAVLGVALVDWFMGFLKFVPRLYQEEILPMLNYIYMEITERMTFVDPELTEKINEVFQNFIGNIGNYISSFSMNAIKVISGGIAGIPGLIIKLILMVISCFFFLLDYDKIMAFFAGLVPKGKEKAFETIQWYVKNTLLVYIRSYTLLFLMTYVELTIGFQILGIPYAPIIALIISVFDILPVLGTGGILLPWTVVLLVMKNYPMGIGMFVLYLIITIIRNTMEPKLVGKQIGLHPLATMISLYVGLKIIGFWGMLIFPTTLAVISSMKKEIQERES
ncbi:MAG: sporulation integral membrane protein YtvI [Lachnospiraceae bacterium]|nr:sporulation integral membrane protein YtvI [Lachnospiraceae bacterium]